MATKKTKRPAVTPAKTLAQTFSENMKNRRQKLGLSQEKLAAEAKLSISYVSMLERGQRSPPLDTIESVCRALKVPPVAMFA